jgi:uncharacterized protein (TIGR03089 family)
MRDLLASDPGRPRVTWYGPDGERVEFSAKTLDNWVSKTANLLVDELDAGPEALVGIALPAHWRTVVWLLAAWTVGAHVLVLADGLPAARPDGAEHGPGRLDVLVTDRPSAPPPGTEESVLVAVALPALATRYVADDLPMGAVDAAAEVRRQPDVHVPGPPPDPARPGFTAGATSVPHGGLLSAAGTVLAGTALPDGSGGPPRLLTGAGPDQAIEAYLAPLAAGGSVVIHHDLAALSDEELEHLIAQEAVTVLDLER